MAFTDISSIHQDIVIYVNSSILLLPPEVFASESSDKRFWVSNDTLNLKWSYFWTHVVKSDCTKLVRSSWKEHDDIVQKHNMIYFDPRPVDADMVENGKFCRTSSVPAAIDLAILMRCNPIYLLGVDHRMVNGKSHFWQFWDKKKQPTRIDQFGRNFHYSPEQKHQIGVFEKNTNVYEHLKKYAEQFGIEIYNCSVNSIMDVFKIKELKYVAQETASS